MVFQLLRPIARSILHGSRTGSCTALRASSFNSTPSFTVFRRNSFGLAAQLVEEVEMPYQIEENVGVAVPATPAETVPVVETKAKLHGRAFYESIGSPKFVIAPMVDASELAWRLLSRPVPSSEPQHNPILAYTPMYHSRIFATDASYRRTSFQCPPFPSSLLGASKIDRPLFVQFCSNTPQDFLAAAKYVAPYCDAVDLNLGCPQGIARKGHYGSFLQDEWELIENMISTLHKELSIPVTAKIRIFETKEKTLEYAKMVLRAGASILTVHGRRREQKGQLTGLADWSFIRYLRDNLPSETVIFANGNILWQEDVERCLRETGADAVMSAEANLSNPTGIFLPVSAPWDEKFPRMDIVARKYLELIKEHIMPPLLANLKSLRKKENNTDECLTAIKSHLFKLLHPLLQKHTDIRAALGRSTTKKAMMSGQHTTEAILGDFEIVVSMVETAVRTELEQNPEPVDSEGNWMGPDVEGGSGGFDMGNGKRRVVPYYRCQPQIRDSPEEAERKGAIRPKSEKVPKKDMRRVGKGEEGETGEKRKSEGESGECGEGEGGSKRVKVDGEEGSEVKEGCCY